MANLIDEKELQNLLDKDILELIGAGNLPQDKKQVLYLKLAQTVQNRAIARIYDKLTDQEGQELDRLLDTGDKNQVDAFLKQKGIDITSLLLQEAVILKSEMTNIFQASSQAPEKGNLPPVSQPNPNQTPKE